MNKTPTLLMKELNFIKEETNRLHEEDENKSYAPLNDKMEFKYDTGYSYMDNRKRINELYSEELKIRSILAKFNSTTKVIGYDYTINEALVKISQLKNEISVLTKLANKQEYSESYSRRYSSNETITNKINYDQHKVREDLRLLQKELSNLQMAVDKTNLTTLIEY